MANTEVFGEWPSEISSSLLGIPLQILLGSLPIGKSKGQKGDNTHWGLSGYPLRPSFVHI